MLVLPNIQVTEIRKQSTVEDGLANIDSRKYRYMHIFFVGDSVVRIGPSTCLVEKTEFLLNSNVEEFPLGLLVSQLCGNYLLPQNIFVNDVIWWYSGTL